MAEKKDRFSNHAKQYAAFRPRYPDELYAAIFKEVRNFGVAWDAGTGNGQAAVVLARHFTKVYATDISERQLKNAVKAENLFYAIGETLDLPDHSIDLITVAQAIHWFDRDQFYTEVKRVAKPGAVVAIWGYGLLSVSAPIDALINHFYVSIVGPFWDLERKQIDQKYGNIDFPFREVVIPEMKMTFVWTLAEWEGYLTTWSSVQKIIQVRGVNPVTQLISEVKPYWKGKMEVTFPLFMRLGSI